MVLRILVLFIVLVGSAAAGTAERARTNYLLHCSGCHQQDGSGSVSNGIPDMRDKVGNFLHTPEGRAFLVQVPGTSQSRLDDGAVAELLNWMVAAFSRNEVPKDFVPYSHEEVTRLRAHRLEDVPGFRAATVQRLLEMGFRVE